MGQRLSPAAVAFQDQVLAVLRDAQGTPLATHEVAERTGWFTGQATDRLQTWRCLDRLAKAGQVQRWPPPDPASRATYWTLPPSRHP